MTLNNAPFGTVSGGTPIPVERNQICSNLVRNAVFAAVKNRITALSMGGETIEADLTVELWDTRGRIPCHSGGDDGGDLLVGDRTS